jgi:hypothetical protein
MENIDSNTINENKKFTDGVITIYLSRLNIDRSSSPQIFGRGRYHQID